MDAVATLGLIACVFGAYFPALNGAPLWDDSAHITRPGLRSLDGLWRIWTVPGATQQYYPLLHTAFWVEHLLWGDAVLGYHVLTVALHVLAACLLVKIVRRLAIPGAWLAGFLFALHPVCVEAVAWIAEQKSTLSAVFYLAAALAYLKFDESRKRASYIAALAFFVAALLAKTVTAALPGVLLALLWWRRKGVEWRRDVRPLLPFFALGAAAGIVTIWVESALIGARGAEFALSAIQRLLLAGRVICFYAAKAVAPIHLAFFYPHWTINPSAWQQWIFPAAVVAAAFFLRRRRGPFAAFLIFTGTLFPVLGFFNVFPFRYSYVADHFAYLAMFAVAVPAAALLSRARPFAGALVVAALFVLTFRQSGVYRDEETLYRATLRTEPEAWLAHNNLGSLLLARDPQSTEALWHIEAALRLAPGASEPHLNMGNALLGMRGRLNEAIDQYRVAVTLAPESERAHTNLGNALLMAGRTAEAMPQLREALRLDSANPEAHNDLGNAFMQLPGRLSEAIAQYRLALTSNPDFAEAHNNLGRALASAGELPDAIAEFQAAIRAKPDYAGAHSNLGNALSMMPGRLEDGIAEYREAIRLRPDSSTAHNNVGYALSKLPGQLADAIAEYREAIRLDPTLADAHYNLGAALAQSPATAAEGRSEMETGLRLKQRK